MSCCTFFNFLQKQSKGVVHVLIRAVLFLKEIEKYRKAVCKLL